MKKILLLIGGLSLFLSSIKAQIPNGGFENWDTTNLFIYKHIYPIGWMSNNLYWQSVNKQNAVVPSTDAHSGNYSMKMTVLNDTSEYKQGASCGTFEGDLLMGEANGKFAINSKPAGIEFWHKFTSPKKESFLLFVNLYNGENQVGSAMIYSEENSTSWSKLASVIDYSSNESPDSASISIMVGFSDTPTVGTVFMIDDLSFTTTTAINEVSIENGLNVYPNPSSGEINITLNDAPSKDLLLSLKDISGRTIKTFSNEELVFSHNEIKLKINSYDPGIYLLEMKSNSKILSKRIILQ
ncbi:MAG: T9SS type A sorting domain-containing protein [Bacteroidia bacterium]